MNRQTLLSLTAGLSCAALLAFGPAPAAALDAQEPSATAAPEGAPQRRDCPAEVAVPAQSGSALAGQLRQAIFQNWAPGPVDLGDEAIRLDIRLCPGSAAQAPLDVFIMRYDGPEGASQEALIGAMMVAIRRTATAGPGFQAAMMELGNGIPEDVVLDLTFRITPDGKLSHSAPDTE